MNARKKAEMKANYRIQEVLNSSAAITATFPNFPPIYTSFKNSFGTLVTLTKNLEFSREGAKSLKRQARGNLVGMCYDYSIKLLLFARFVNNITLSKEVSTTENKISKLSDHDLRSFAQGIYDRAQTNLAALATYGITAATQTALQAAIDTFVVQIPKIALINNDIKQLNQQIRDAFKISNAALDNIDLMVESVKKTQPTFYNSYQTVRRLEYSRNNPIALKGKIFDADGQPVKNAQVSIKLANDPSLVAKSATSLTVSNTSGIVKKTAKKGGFNVKNLPEGIYTITISKLGFQDQEVTATIVNGEPVRLNLTLQN
jgi:hypothetical protein